MLRLKSLEYGYSTLCASKNQTVIALKFENVVDEEMDALPVVSDGFSKEDWEENALKFFRYYEKNVEDLIGENEELRRVFDLAMFRMIPVHYYSDIDNGVDLVKQRKQFFLFMRYINRLSVDANRAMGINDLRNMRPAHQILVTRPTTYTGLESFYDMINTTFFEMPLKGVTLENYEDFINPLCCVEAMNTRNCYCYFKPENMEEFETIEKVYRDGKFMTLPDLKVYVYDPNNNIEIEKKCLHNNWKYIVNGLPQTLVDKVI